MIVNIRGTHGSGKSTVVRRILESFESTPVFISGRARPFGYFCKNGPYIPGQYETPTGGCDTISSIELIFDAVKTAADGGHDVLFEGIVAQHSAGRLLELNKIHPVTVLVLTTPEQLCIDSVMVRRISRGQDGDFDPKNIIKEFKSVKSSTLRLRRDGMKIQEMDREQAFNFCLTAFKRSKGSEESAQCAE